MAVLHKILLMMTVLEKHPDEKLEDTLNLEKDETHRLLSLLRDLELVAHRGGSEVLTTKGRNVLEYFNDQLGLDNAPLIRV